MTAEKLLIELEKKIQKLSDTEYDRLCEITGEGSENFVGLNERQVRHWLGWENNENKEA